MEQKYSGMAGVNRSTPGKGIRELGERSSEIAYLTEAR